MYRFKFPVRNDLMKVRRICLDITLFYKDLRQTSSGSAWPACPKKGKSGPHCWGREGSTQFAPQFVTALPLVDCVVWSLCH